MVCPEMNEENKKAIHTLYNKGEEEALKYMCNPSGDKPLTYSENARKIWISKKVKKIMF